MIKCFAVNNDTLENNISPNYYLFRDRINSLSKRKDIISFSLGDEDVLEVLTDGEHAGQKFYDNGALFIKNSSVKRYGVNELDGFYISHDKNNQLKRSRLQKDDVLFTTIGNFLGVSAIVNENVENANINQNVVRMRINPVKVKAQYLMCFLNSKFLRFQIENLFTGNTYPILTYPKIKSLRVFLKNRQIEDIVVSNIIKAENNHQKAISLINQARNLFLESLLTNFNKIKTNKFYAVTNDQLMNNDMLTPSYYYPLYNNTIKDIKKNNLCMPLGELVKFKRGNEVGSNNYKTLLNKKETDVPFIRTSDLINYDIDMYPDFFINKSIYDDLNQQITPGEILFSKDGKIGLTAFITNFDKCILSSGILRICAHQNMINPYYLFIVLSTKQIGLYQAYQRTVVASTIPHLREDRIFDFQIPIIENQKEVADLTIKAFKLKDERKKLINDSMKIIENSLLDLK